MKRLLAGVLAALACAAVGAAPLEGVVQVSAGGGGTCAVMSDGRAKCWGHNAYGQVGDGTTTQRPFPADAAGVEGIAQLSLGEANACAVWRDGGVKCWGYDRDANANRLEPTAVEGLGGRALAVSVTWDRACAVMEGGAVKCWGQHFAMRLGGATPSAPGRPVQVVGVAGATRISTGTFHTCAVRDGGRVRCWGNGYLGDGTVSDGSSVDVVGIEDAVDVAAADLVSCAVLRSGRVKCWGGGFHGELGHGSVQLRSLVPVEVVGIDDALAISGMGNAMCALTSAALVKCWGSNSGAVLGDGTTASSSVPVPVQGLRARVASLSVGYKHACVAYVTGQADCWGFGYWGQLGDGMQHVPWPAREAPPVASGLAGMATSSSFYCGVGAGGSVHCAGSGGRGELGNGRYDDSSAPLPVSGVSGATRVQLGTFHACAIAAGTLKCWGINTHGELGTDKGTFSSNLPLEVKGLAGAALDVTMGPFYTCALVASGRVQCWGLNQWGVLGVSSNQLPESATPRDVISAGAVSLAGGESHACAIMSDARLRCWGDPYALQGGVPAHPTYSSTALEALGPLAAAAAGGGFTCVVSGSGVAYCWGRNDAGQLGDGTKVARWSLQAVAGIDRGAVGIAAGSAHACAVTVDGALWCWGRNDQGQLGDGTTEDRPAPVKVLQGGIVRVSAGGSTTCVTRTDGSHGCWGPNHYGQLGVPVSRGHPASVQAGGRPVAASRQGLWWGGPSQNGWGMSLTQHGDVLFGALFVYDAAGAARWYVMPGGTWSADGRTYAGAVYFPSSSPFSAYDASRFVVGAPVGSVAVTFEGEHAVLDASIAGSTRRTGVTRQLFGAGVAANNRTDLWWGGVAQDGWGMALTQQGDTVFGVWYTYDAGGRPTWYVMPAGVRDTASHRYSGTLYETANPSGWLGGAYDPARLRVQPVGSIGFEFSSHDAGTVSYTVNGVTQQKAISRQPF